MLDSGNPFSTRHVQPGAIPYQFPEGVTPAHLIDELRRRHWWGQVLGPHGCGKTTLLLALLPALKQAGRQVQRFTLRAGQGRLNVPTNLKRQWNATTQLVIDGYEQLSWLSRWRLQRQCRRHSVGLLVTSHRQIGLPTLLHVRPNCETATRLALRLTQHAPGLIDERDVRRCFEQQAGNIREVFFSLYDLCEQRRQSPSQSPPSA
jgi:hypothetical protein